MTTPFVPAGEFGRVRVFALAPSIVPNATNDDSFTALATALGTPSLDPADVQLVDVGTLGDLGFAGFLQAAYGISTDQIVPAVLNAEGHVAVLRSGAFGGRETMLSEAGGAELIATLDEPQAAPPLATPLSSDSAESGSLAAGDAPHTRKRMSDARIGGMVATVVLLFLAIFVVVFVLIGS